ncbi:LPXTG cell wall anchor domain-containing protein [Aerococcus tenax]|uniref:LPXTG cell wall anchor domain-containing protein n=1 Tax=Aerococcus tenax TaxID=3078812 RepID=UPI0018A6F7EF|nr:LPXTG cell wall anchor domain-containing protein [Aerococcus tenax]
MKTKYFPLATASLVLTALLANQVTVSAQETTPANYAVESNSDVPNETRATNLPAKENSVSVSDEKALAASESGYETNTDKNRDKTTDEVPSKPFTEAEKQEEYVKEVTEKNKEAILNSYNDNKAKLPNTIFVDSQEDEYRRIDRLDHEIKNKIFNKNVSHDIKIDERKREYLDLNQKLDNNLILESYINLDQNEVKEQSMKAIRAIRAHMWDIDHGLNALEDIYDPETGKKIEGIWVKGQRLTERAEAAGIRTKDDYVNNIQWNRDLENIALQNLAEIVNIESFYHIREFYYTKPDSKKYPSIDNFFNIGYQRDSNLENHLLNTFIYPEIIKHNKNYGKYKFEQYHTIGNIINLLLDPYNKSVAVASNKTGDLFSELVVLASPVPSKDSSSSNYKGSHAVLVNGDKDRIEDYELYLPDKLYENTNQKLNVFVKIEHTKKQKIKDLNFSGKITSMNPEILEIDEQGVVHAKKAGEADIILSLNGIVQRKRLKVQPRPIAEDRVYYELREYYEPIEYRENPNMLRGKQKTIQEYKPGIDYYVDRWIYDEIGTLNYQKDKIFTIPGSKKIIEYGTKVLEEKHPEKVEPEVPDEKPAMEAKPEENNSPNNSTGVIFGRPYENNPGYIELIPGYYVQLEPEHEDQTVRINEKEFDTEIRTRKDLKAGEYRIIQQGQNAYIALTNRVYKDHLGNVLKTQEIGRQRVEGKPLIIEVGVESNGQPTVSINKPETKAPETTMSSNNNKKLPVHELEDNSSPSIDHNPLEKISIPVDSTSDNKEVNNREGENNSSPSTINKPVEEDSIKAVPTFNSRAEESSTSSIFQEFPISVGPAKTEVDSADLVAPEVAEIEEKREEDRVLASSDTISKNLSKNSPTKYVSAPLSNSEIHSSSNEQDVNNPVLAKYAKDTHKDLQKYRQPQQVASKLPETGTMDNKLPLAIGLTTVLTGLLSFKVSRRRSH